MTATRIVRGATIAAAVAVWLVVAALLWRTMVPDDLRLPRLDEDAVFGQSLVDEARGYERALNLFWLGATVTELVVLAVCARRGSRLARGLGLGRVNAGIVVAVVTLTAVWAAGLPWVVVSQWWARRHGISFRSYAATVSEAWVTLLVTTFVAFLALAVILGLAKALRARWWLAAAPTIAALLTVIQLVSPYLVRAGTHPLRDRSLARELRQLETREGAGRPTVRVQEVREETRAANAFSIGFGPSTSVIFWDTLLRQFDPRAVRFVAAHELAHIARGHVLKGIAWAALLALPILGTVAFVTERRGGLREPRNVPLGLLVLVLAMLAVLPLQNAISRRYEAEADWVAVEATRDPGAAGRLFRGFAADSLQDPTPPAWVHALLDDHPTLLQRVELARAWARIQAGG
jgi:STE24 endopeptidase